MFHYYVLYFSISFQRFMWLMGVCIPISIRSLVKRKSSKNKAFLKILKRSLWLFILGLAISNVNYSKSRTRRMNECLHHPSTGTETNQIKIYNCCSWRCSSTDNGGFTTVCFYLPHHCNFSFDLLTARYIEARKCETSINILNNSDNVYSWFVILYVGISSCMWGYCENCFGMASRFINRHNSSSDRVFTSGTRLSNVSVCCWTKIAAQTWFSRRWFTII